MRYRVKADFPNAPAGAEFNMNVLGDAINVRNGHTRVLELSKEQADMLRMSPNLVVTSEQGSVVGKKSEAKETQEKLAGKDQPSEEAPPVPPETS